MRIRARVFKLTRALVGHGPLEPLHSALWLRLLAAADLDDLTVDSYSGRARTGFESASFNQQGLFDWEAKTVGESVPAASRVLIAAAGGGREAIALARMGHDVTAFDASPDLVEACRLHLAEAGLAGAVHCAPPGGVPAGLERFEVLMIGRGSFHHIPGRAQRIAFLKACRATVVAGAPILLGDVLMRAEGAGSSRSRNRRVEAGDSIGTSFYHRFTGEEIATELEEGGFVLDEIRRTPFSLDSQLCHAIGRAR